MTKIITIITDCDNTLMPDAPSLLLKDNGIATIEFPHLLNLIEKNQFDTIYHEHLRYYSLSSLKYLFDKYLLNDFTEIFIEGIVHSR